MAAVKPEWAASASPARGGAPIHRRRPQAWVPRQNSFVDRDLDASLLRLHEVGFVPAEDPLFAGTVAAIERHLRHGDHLFRYGTADDFGMPTTASTVCTFWYIDALAAMRRRDEARAIFERVLACRKPCRPAVGGPGSLERRAVGQLSAELLDGGSDRLRHAAQQELAKGLPPHLTASPAKDFTVNSPLHLERGPISW